MKFGHIMSPVQTGCEHCNCRFSNNGTTGGAVVAGGAEVVLGIKVLPLGPIKIISAIYALPQKSMALPPQTMKFGHCFPGLQTGFEQFICRFFSPLVG
jgi:hypothetical protein